MVATTNDLSESNKSSFVPFYFNPMRSAYENNDIGEEIRKHLGEEKPYLQPNKAMTVERKKI